MAAADDRFPPPWVGLTNLPFPTIIERRERGALAGPSWTDRMNHRHANVVVCHGGSGTAFGALAAGVPLIICPLFADQSSNGQLIASAGAGLVAPGRACAPGGLRGIGPADVVPLRDTIEQVLDRPSYRHHAKRLAIDMVAMPTLDETVEQVLAAR
jgi:UDP:flavonoid glycosyltransferase YjiC (YdhE family)